MFELSKLLDSLVYCGSGGCVFVRLCLMLHLHSHALIIVSYQMHLKNYMHNLGVIRVTLSFFFTQRSESPFKINS